MNIKFKSMLVGCLLATGVNSAFAGKVYCPEVAGGVETLWWEPIIQDEVVVKNGVCNMKGTQVEGDVKVGAGGALIVYENTVIEGDLKCSGCLSTSVLGGTIMGDVKIRGASGQPPGSKSSGHDSEHPDGGDIEIYGDVKYINNKGPVYARGADIHGDLKVINNNNELSINGPNVSGNVVYGDLKCRSNSPSPFAVAINEVEGDKKGQCAEDLGF